MSAAVVSAIASAATTVLLAGAIRILHRMSKNLKRFMQEHLWLLASADWSRKSITQIMRDLGINGDPPPDWPGRK